jgi:hypothetical protein
MTLLHITLSHITGDTLLNCNCFQHLPDSEVQRPIQARMTGAKCMNENFTTERESKTCYYKLN